MPDVASLSRKKTDENLLEMLLDYTENGIYGDADENLSNNDDPIHTQGFRKYIDEGCTTSSGAVIDTEVISHDEAPSKPDGALEQCASGEGNRVATQPNQTVDQEVERVFDSSNTKQLESKQRIITSLTKTDRDVTGQPFTHGAMIDYHKVGAQRVEDLFSREQFCSMSAVFDELLKQVKEQLNSNYGRVREEMQFAAKQVVSAEMNRVLLTAQQLRDQVVSLRSLVQNQERMIARKDQVIDDLMADLKRVNQNAEKVRDQCRTAKEEFCSKLVDRYARKRLLTQAFTTWKSSLEQTWKARVMKRLQDEARVECERLITEHNTKTQQLENELQMAHLELEATRATQAEENAALKTALMRGVCALNMETMSLFNRDTRTQSDEFTSVKNSNQNAHNWSTAEVIQCYQAGLVNRFGLRTAPSSTPTPRRLDGTANGNPPGLPEPNFHQAHEAWPRQMPTNSIATKSANGNFSNAFPAAQQYPNEICARWLNQTQQNTNHGQSVLDNSSFKPVTQHHISSTSQFHVPDGGSPNSVEAECFTPSSNTEDCQVMELPITTVIKPETQIHPNSSFSNAMGSLNTSSGLWTAPMSSEGARKQLISRTASAQKTLNNSNPVTRWSNLPKAHTVQLGVPTGPSSHSSSVTASVQVLRHQPVSQATLTCQINSSMKRKEGNYNPPMQSQVMYNNKRGAHPTSNSSQYPIGLSIHHG